MSASSSSLGWDANTILNLQESLKKQKNLSSRNTPAFFPSQAVTRGGIGNLVSSGAARGPLTKLPAAEKARRASARSASASNTPRNNGNLSSRSFGGSLYPGEDIALAVTASALLGGGVGVPEVAKHEWERGAVAHPYPFCPAARRVGVKDHQNPRWASLSYFENKEREVKKHIDMVARDELNHENFVRNLDADADVRHQTWAAQQREVFHRQREEKADLYARSGAAVRKAYLKSFAASRPMTAPAGRTFAPSSPLPLPKQTQLRVYKKLEVENLEMVATAAERVIAKAKEAERVKEEEEIRESLGAIERFEVMTLREVLRKQATERKGGRSRGNSRTGGYEDY